MSDWKDVLKQQNADLERLEALDKNLNAEAADLERDTHNVGFRRQTSILKTKVSSGLPARQRLEHRQLSEKVDHYDEPGDIGEPHLSLHVPIPDMTSSESNADTAASGGINDGSSTPRAPESTIRYQKARINILSKQIEDGNVLRKQMSEQINELQKQLKLERDENKTIKKRVGTLEVELKRASSSTRRPSDAGAVLAAGPGGASVESLQQEIISLKKDVASAEKVAKQLDSQVKTKELQLKRAAETITKLSSQLNDLQTHAHSGSKVDSARLQEAEARIELLEKQRAEVLAAFKKQMRLIDVLRRQKTHLEAARLLSFTEDEFLKTLDWAV